MAKRSIDIFPFLKQWKADISQGFPFMDNLAISADHLYESWWETAKTHIYFQREIKEGM